MKTFHYIIGTIYLMLSIVSSITSYADEIGKVHIKLSDSSIINIKSIDSIFNTTNGNTVIATAINKPAFNHDYSSILLANGGEYFLSRNTSANEIIIRTRNGNDIAINTNLDNKTDQDKISTILQAVGQKTLQSEAIWVTFQSCSDCWVDSYCAYNCSGKPVCKSGACAKR